MDDSKLDRILYGYVTNITTNFQVLLVLLSHMGLIWTCSKHGLSGVCALWRTR